jgi:hypothetical protein
MEQGMTQHVAYKWRGDLYCEDDIVAVFTEHFPWHVWRDAGGDPTADDAETELNEIADMFRINRSDPRQLAQHDFPERLGDGHPGYCTFCLRWFDHYELPTERNQP